MIGSDNRKVVASVGMWTVQILVAAMFLMAGSMKLSGAPMLVAEFEKLGMGQWFRVLTGSIEVVAAIALLLPGLVDIGALLLTGVMLGALVAHTLVLGIAGAGPALFLLLTSLLILWTRRTQLAMHMAMLRG